MMNSLQANTIAAHEEQSPTLKKPAVRDVISACFFCSGYCGVVISLDEDDRIVKVVGDKNNPNSRGFICNKGVNMHTLLDSPRRLTRPLQRVNGVLVEVSWHEALTGLARDVNRIRARHGANAIGMAFGGAECQTPAHLAAGLLMPCLGSSKTFTPAGLEFLARYLTISRMRNTSSSWVAILWCRVRPKA
jgi:anaerobic selenocysteine-containing dehydrogenase